MGLELYEGEKYFSFKVDSQNEQIKNLALKICNFFKPKFTKKKKKHCVCVCDFTFTIWK